MWKWTRIQLLLKVTPKFLFQILMPYLHFIVDKKSLVNLSFYFSRTHCHSGRLTSLRDGNRCSAIAFPILNRVRRGANVSHSRRVRSCPSNFANTLTAFKLREIYEHTPCVHTAHNGISAGAHECGGEGEEPNESGTAKNRLLGTTLTIKCGTGLWIISFSLEEARKILEIPRYDGDQPCILNNPGGLWHRYTVPKTGQPANCWHSPVPFSDVSTIEPIRETFKITLDKCGEQKR